MRAADARQAWRACLAVWQQGLLSADWLFEMSARQPAIVRVSLSPSMEPRSCQPMQQGQVA